MSKLIIYKATKIQQYVLSILSVVIVSTVCFFLSDIIGYHVVALLLLVVVSLAAMFFDIIPVLLAALLSAVIWDVFFIPPRFTLLVATPEDGLLLAMYFIIACVNGMLTFKIRKAEKVARKKEEKENTVKLYKTLLNSLSHELRTPIATIIGASDNLMTASSKLTGQNKEDLISEISKAALRLNRQVDNLLNMSRIESGTMQLKLDWVDINELIYDVVKRIKASTPNHPINIIIQESLPLFKLDYVLMEQVIYNLVYNAAIYIPKYSVITIRAKSIDDNLVLEVEDTGDGFPEDEISKVFDKFYRLKNTATGGTGLGLSIVKGFVQAHNGIVHLENLLPSGAKFTIVIPAEVSYLGGFKNITPLMPKTNNNKNSNGTPFVIVEDNS